MGLFVRDDDYNESIRMTGFNRYKQLLSFFAGHWTVLNILTFFSAIPLILGITFSILSTSLLLLLPTSFLGGLILGPFLAALVDSIQRSLREDTGLRWENYKKGLSQNWKCSFIPGGITGIIIGIYIFLFYLIIYENALTLSFFSIILIFISMILFLIIENLYWPQLVLFAQPLRITLTNILLFTCKYLWKMFGIAILQILYISFIVIFAPYTFFLLPFLGIWYYIFFSQFLIYEKFNEELQIESKFKDL